MLYRCVSNGGEHEMQCVGSRGCCAAERCRVDGGLHGLVQQDRALTARLLLHLGEVEARGLYRDRGFSSMFDYAVEALHMSPNEAYVRLREAKVARDFPWSCRCWRGTSCI